MYYRTCYQPIVALISTEAEFTAATEACKAILYVCTILDELGKPQSNATILHIDNHGALNMAKSTANKAHTPF